MGEEKMRLDKDLGCIIKTGDITVTGRTCDEALKTLKEVKKLRGV